jgi:cobalt-zinc-cadmium efflux system membrane fusion protein
MKNIVLILFSSFLLAACGSKTTGEKTEPDSTAHNLISLTPAQYKAADITVGKIEQKSISKNIAVNGKLDVPPQNLVTIAAPMGGFVKSTSMLQGMKVKKGDVLAVLENQEYIQLQQEYLDNISKLEFLEGEYNRQLELANENVNSKKTLQQAKSQYESVKAMVSGLEAKLAMINISPASLKEGKISSSIKLHAPIHGFVTKVNVNVGQFVNATDALFNIVNLEHMHAELQVYEKDITAITIGQKVNFRLASETTDRLATVYLIGREIGPDRTVQVHCHLEREDQGLLPGMFIHANVEVSAQLADVVPTSALVNFEGHNFVFVPAGENQFKAIQVTAGSSVHDYTEIQLTDELTRDTPIVIKGAFELLGVLKNTEEE